MEIVDAIRKVEHFENFAKSLKVSGKDNWSNVQALLTRGGEDATWKNANISVTVEKDVEGNRVDALGINNVGGVLNLTGEQTTVKVRQNAKPMDTNEGNIGAVGYLSIDSYIYPENHSVVTNFNADKTVFDIENTVEGEMAMGISSAGNDEKRPAVNVAGDLDVKVKSAEKGLAVGVYSDIDLEKNPSIDNPGNITMAKNLTVNVIGGSSAFGISADVGNLVVKGDTNITAKAVTPKQDPRPEENLPADGAYGIYATSTGHITLEGNETVVTAENALWVTEHTTIIDTTYTTMENGQKVEKEWRPATLNAQVDLHSKTTTLNGKAYVQAGRTLDLQNTINFNGDANLEGKVIGSADVVIANQGVMTLSKDAKTFKNVTFNGGTVENSAKIKADKIVLGEGVRFKDTIADTDNIAADHYVFGKNSKYLISAAQLDSDTSATKTAFTFSDNVMEFAGGTVATIENPAVTKIAVRLETDSDANEGLAAKNDGQLVISAGDYDWDEVSINMNSTETGRFVVSGGKLKTAVFNATNGNAIISEKGSLAVEKLVADGNFGVKAASEFTVGTFEGAQKGNFHLQGGNMNVDTLKLDAGNLVIANGGTLATGSAQVFTTALNKDGKNTSAGDLRWGDALVFEDGSTLTLDDAFFNDKYAESAYTALKSSAELKKPTLVFSGTKVDLAGDEIKDTGLGDMKDGVVEENTNITTTDKNISKDGTLAVDKTVGGQTLTVAAGGTTVSVSVDKKLTLAGSADGDELVIFDKDTKGDKKVTASGKDGGLTLGSTKNETKGNLSATVELSNQAKDLLNNY